jgi:hypothetical protein
MLCDASLHRRRKYDGAFVMPRGLGRYRCPNDIALSQLIRGKQVSRKMKNPNNELGCIERKSGSSGSRRAKYSDCISPCWVQLYTYNVWY